MSATEAAIGELEYAGLLGDNSEYDGLVGRSVKELLLVLGNQGHSGGSHALVLELFNRVASGHPLTDLCGAEEQWVDHHNNPHMSDFKPAMRYQSRRVSTVFTNDFKRAQYIEGVRFVGKDGDAFWGEHSFVWFDLPGLPPATVDVTAQDWLTDRDIRNEFPNAFPKQTVKRC